MVLQGLPLPSTNSGCYLTHPLNKIHGFTGFTSTNSGFYLAHPLTKIQLGITAFTLNQIGPILTRNEHQGFY